MRGVFCSSRTLHGFFIYVNEQDVIDRPAMKQALGAHSKFTKPSERWDLPSTTGDEPATFVGFEFNEEDYKLMKAFLIAARFREDESIGQLFVNKR